jgi:rubrerythrin
VSELNKLLADWYQRSLQIAEEHDTCVRIVEVEAYEPMTFPTTKPEPSMEKRGVVIDYEKTKTAEQTKRCPDCGLELDEPNKCPRCGTKPFERKP